MAPWPRPPRAAEALYLRPERLSGRHSGPSPAAAVARARAAAPSSLLFSAVPCPPRRAHPLTRSLGLGTCPVAHYALGLPPRAPALPFLASFSARSARLH